MPHFANLSYGPYGERNLLDLYLPDGSSAPPPLVVCIHGGGWRGGSKEAFGWMGAALAERGFAAASLTYRFWPDWPYPAALDDVRRALRWLRSQAQTYAYDPERVGAIGGSAGAHLASFLGLTEAPEEDPALAGYASRVHCVVDCYGPVDFPLMMTTGSAPLVGGFMGVPFTPETEALYRQASPIFHITGTPPPFLLVHGTLDGHVTQGNVPYEISVDFHARLRQAGGDATLLLLEGAGHGFSGNPDNPYTQQMWAAAAPFFERHLR